MSDALAACEPRLAERARAVFDPPDQQLGSGGGTAHAVHQAWRHSGVAPFTDWLHAKPRTLIHGGGESRRLPAYATTGKLFLPAPVVRWERGQRLDQTLLELNQPFLNQVVASSDPVSRLLIASGDVLLRSSRPIANLPPADVVILGMWASPEEAQHFGVLLVDPHQPERLITFLQKPSPDEIRRHSREVAFLLDVGAWLLSERAVECLLAKCGYNAAQGTFHQGMASPYDLYGQWALSLGEQPQQADPEIGALSVAVAPIREGEFYHFGTTADLIESTYQLQNVVRDQTSIGVTASLAQPRQFIQNAHFGAPVRLEKNHSLWVENSVVPASWQLAARHVITGVPQNDWQLTLPAGVCLDLVPIDQHAWAVRCYGYSDTFRGPVSDPATQWLEAPIGHWFAGRSMALRDAHIDPHQDLQQAPLFPVLAREQLSAELVEWMISPHPKSNRAARELWLTAERYSARQLAQQTNLQRLYAQRLELRQRALPKMVAHGAKSVFYKIDLAAAAQTYASSTAPTPCEPPEDLDTLQAAHHQMFRGEVKRLREQQSCDADEQQAFDRLAEAIVDPYRKQPVVPEFRLADDQIVWGRSPIRIDLAGGWTDTPPYCLQHGGSVVNVAVKLNDQAPIQAFARRCRAPTITLHSIDLGISQTLTTYEEVGDYRGVGSGFTVPKAALSLAGFHPDFNGGRFESLAAQLDHFGGGIELTMLSGVPKGSGLGASSILSATVLGTLSNMCSHNWDVHQIATRTSAVEQMLGSGGGWQDQYGGLIPGAKLIESRPGLQQSTVVRRLSAEFFSSPAHQSRAVLYYTGITRVARDVLQQIVRGMFLNEQSRLTTLTAIGRNSHACFDAIQQEDLTAYATSIAQSWRLNTELDGGANPPAVVEVIDRVAPHAEAFKLCGAGGGGFLYVLCHDEAAAQALRRELAADPPNSRARFFDMDVSITGLRVTRS